MIQSHVSEILKILLFVDEIRLTGDGVQGSDEFVTEFRKRGKSYNQWSLRDLRLQKRLFKYRCSFMINSASFKMLPVLIKTETLRQLHGILVKAATPEGLPKLSGREKERIHQILMHTHPDYQQANPER